MAMSRLEISQVLLMRPDGFLELLDVLGAALSKSSLGLAVSLLPLLRRRIDLPAALAYARKQQSTHEPLSSTEIRRCYQDP